jgi:hypothetical protein
VIGLSCPNGGGLDTIVGLSAPAMDALFVVVAELLIIPLILWGLIALELTVGVVTSIVSVLLGRRSATDAMIYRWRAVRRRMLWSLILFSSGLLLADLVFFETLVTMALGSADERDDLDVHFTHAGGSFILGRIELQDLTLGGVRGGDDPDARFAVSIESLVIDIDTAALLTADFAVEEIAVDGIVGSFDRLRRREPERKEKQRDLDLSREFSVQRLHVGDMKLALRDHTRAPLASLGGPRALGGGEAKKHFELEVEIAELDLGPLHSSTALFDLLYRVRGHGSVAGHPFVLTAVEHEGVAQSTLELRDVPLDALGEQLEKAAGVRARGNLDLTLVNTYSDGPPEPKVDLAIGLRLRKLELEAGPDSNFSTKLMLEMAERALLELGNDFPLEFEISLLRSELQGARSIAEAGVAERIADGIATALRDELRKRGGEP